MATHKQERSTKTLKILKVSPTLPEEIITEILLRLTVVCLLRLKSTCKSWYNIITHPDFIRLYSTRHGSNYLFNTGDKLLSLVSYEPEPKFEELDHPFNPLGHRMDVAGTCNGILLIGLYSRRTLIHEIRTTLYDNLFLWNPSTKEYIELPDTLTKLPDHRTECREIAYGLGYDSVMDDYKVVRVVHYFLHQRYKLHTSMHYDYKVADDYESDVHVYSLRTNSCKKIQDVPYFIFEIFQVLRIVPGRFFNGGVHWLAGSTETANSDSPVIASFITKDEVFRAKQLPFSWDVSYCLRLGILDGNLCVYRKKLRHGNNIDVFMMREYAGKESWTQIFNIKEPGEPGYAIKMRLNCEPWCLVFEPVLVTNDKKVLVSWGRKHLFLHNIEDGSTTYLKTKTTDTSKCHFEVVCYIGSLVSPPLLRGRDSR